MLTRRVVQFARSDWWVELVELDGKLHSVDDQPAATLLHRGTGEVLAMDWFRHGVRHRDGGPAAISFQAGKVKQKTWFTDGMATLVGPLEE